jgi:hypothetical protein
MFRVNSQLEAGPAKGAGNAVDVRVQERRGGRSKVFKYAAARELSGHSTNDRDHDSSASLPMWALTMPMG